MKYLWHILFLCLLSAVLWPLNPAYADSTLHTLATAQRQLQAKDYVALRSTLAPLLAMPEPHLEALFLDGMRALETGDTATAIARFRAMLTRDPNLIRPRLELARALQQAGERQAAQYHYEQVLAAGLPEPVARNVFRQLNDIRERNPAFRMTLELTSDSNPTQATQARTVIIGNLPFTLDVPETKTVYGVRATADLIWPLASNRSWYARFYGEMMEYPRRNLDSLNGQASLGKRFDVGRHHAALEAGVHAYSYADRAQYNGELVRATGFYRLSPQLALTALAEIKSHRYTDLTYLDGEAYTAVLTGIVVPRPSQRWELGGGVNYYSAAEAPYSYTQPIISARFAQELPGGWITGVRLQGLFSRYDAPDPFFGVARKEKESRAEFDILNRKLNWWSFSPEGVIGYVKRESNLDLYSYDRFYGRIGLRREF